MIKLIYKKIFIPKYLLKKNKFLINTINIYYKSLIITPFLNWIFLKLYIGNSYITIYMNVKKVGLKLRDLLF